MNHLKAIVFILFAILSFNVSAQDLDKCYRVVVSTNKGDITVALYNETPKHRDNFIKLCQTHFYDSLLFHRIIENFMIQGGDPDSRGAIASKPLGEGGPGYDIPAEIVYPQCFHKRGALAAAREGDQTNPERKSSGSQFYIVWGKRFSKREISNLAKTIELDTNGATLMPDALKETYIKVGGTPHLDGAYTVFGEVVEGLNCVERIQKVHTIENDRPFDDVLILSTQVLEPSK